MITPDEAHRFQPAGNDILIFTPPLAARPATRLKNDGQIRGLFLSHPAELSEGCTSARSVRPYTEPAMAVWVGERKGAPANLALYPVSSLVGKPASADKTENREMPITVARKAFYKADKLNVKWNNAGTMVGSCLLRCADQTRRSSSPTPTSTTPASRTTERRTSTSLLLTVRSMAWLTSTRRVLSTTSLGTLPPRTSACATAVSCHTRDTS